jgi:hypothetical protein
MWTKTGKSCAGIVRFAANYAQKNCCCRQNRIAARRRFVSSFLGTRKRRLEGVLRGARLRLARKYPLGGMIGRRARAIGAGKALARALISFRVRERGRNLRVRLPLLAPAMACGHGLCQGAPPAIAGTVWRAALTGALAVPVGPLQRGLARWRAGPERRRRPRASGQPKAVGKERLSVSARSPSGAGRGAAGRLVEGWVAEDRRVLGAASLGTRPACPEAKVGRAAAGCQVRACRDADRERPRRFLVPEPNRLRRRQERPVPGRDARGPSGPAHLTSRIFLIMRESRSSTRFGRAAKSYPKIWEAYIERGRFPRPCDGGEVSHGKSGASGRCHSRFRL